MHLLNKTTTIFLAALLGISISANADDNCPSTIQKNASALLHSYAKKSVDDPNAFTVAGIGNHAYLLDQSLNPVSPEEMAAMVKKSPKADRAKRIVLVWPYSTWGNAPFAHALEKILKKPVLGFTGPLWWYPDGSAFASQAEQATMQAPNEFNVAQCIAPDGKYHERSKCVKLLKGHASASGILANSAFVLSCDEVRKLEPLAQQGDSVANMKLYFFNYFVNIDQDKSSKYLSNAAYAGEPLANYLIARTVFENSPVNMELYRQLLTRAANGGNEKAQRELTKLGDN